MCCLRVQQSVVKTRFVTEQQQALRIHIQPTDRIDARRKPEICQGPLTGQVRRELAKHTIRFVEGDDHRTYFMTVKMTLTGSARKILR